MREVVSIHVGQCGNQIGSAFWNLLLLEHEKTADDDPVLSSFFHYDYLSNRKTPVMKARALLVDMECGPLQETMKSSLGPLFDETQYIMDVSGAGNNFAQGYYSYGPQYHDRFLEGVRKNVEKCESLQSFFLTHSLGGGTGSGVGSYILTMLADEYNKVTRMSTCIYPSEENDVITSPYNILLSTKELIQSADCVFPLNNSALFSFYQLECPPDPEQQRQQQQLQQQGIIPDKKKNNSKQRGFDEINLIAARMLCNVTSSSRFHGEMNVDLNEIYTNLVPFPKLHFLSTALNVRYPMNSVQAQRLRSDYSRTALQRAFADITSARGQLSGSSVVSQKQQNSVITTASAFLGRGKIILSEFIQCVNHAQQSLQFPYWNQDACKIGMCGTASPGEEMGVMAIYNSTSFGIPLSRDLSNFQRLYRAKAMLHHYTKYVEEEAVREAEYEVSELLADYEAIEKNTFPRKKDEEKTEEELFIEDYSRVLFPAF